MKLSQRLFRKPLWQCIRQAGTFSIIAAAALAFLVSACNTLPANTTTSPHEPLPFSERILSGTLENGLRYYIQENPYPEDRVEIRLNVRTGSLNETDEEQGLAHFVEHMAFNGTKHFKANELITFLEKAGLTFGSHTNAYTSTDVTNYQLSLPLSKPELLDKGFLIVRDWADGLLFDEGEIEKEKGVIVEEWRMRDGVRKRIGDQSRAIILEGSRYPHRDPIGKMEVVQRANRKLLKGYYDANYTPNRMALIVVGNIDAHKMKERIEKALGDMPARTPRKATSKHVPLTKGLRVATITDAEQTTGLAAKDHYHSRGRTTTFEAFKQDITEQIAVAAFNRRIHNMINSGDLPLLISARMRVSDIQENLISARVIARPLQGKMKEGLSSLYTEVERTRRFGFLDSEKEEQITAFTRVLTDRARPEKRIESDGFAKQIVQFDTHGGALLSPKQELDLFTRVTKSLTTEDLSRAFAGLLDTDSQSVMFTLPENRKAEAMDKTSYQALLARITAKELKPFTQGKILTALMEKKPEGGAITSSKELPIISGKEYILSNGVKLIVRPSKSSPGEFTMKALSSGGRSNTEDKDYKRVSLAPAMVAQSGFVGIPQTELKRLMAGRKVGVSAGIDATVASLTGGATIDETEALFQLLNLYFTKPNVTKKALTIQKTRLSQAIKAKKNDKKFVFHARANKEKYNEKFRDTPWTMEDLKTLNVPDLLADFKHFFHSPADFTFTFVGDVNPDEIAKLAATYLGGLPGTPGKATVRDRGLRLRKVTGDQNIRITGTGDLVDRTSVDFTWQADSTFDLTRSARMGLLKRILNRRLRETIREEEGGVYSIGSSLRIQSVPVPLFRGGMGFTCDPERVEELIPKAEKIVHDMGKNGVTEKEVKTAIKQTLTSLKLAKKKNRFWVNSIAICMVRNWPLDQLVNRDQVIANTTTEQVSALAKEHLSGIRGFITIYGPEAGVKSLSDN